MSAERHEPAPGAALDVVFAFSWADTWRDACIREMCMSGDRLVLALLEHPVVGRLAVANPYRSWPAQVARRLLGRRDAPFPHRPGSGLVAPTRLRRGHPVDQRGIEALYAGYDRRLRRAASRLGMVRPAVVTVNPFVAASSALAWAGPVTYYALDHWAAHPRHAHLAGAFERAYEEIRRRRRRVCAVSQPLLDHIAPTGPSAMVPNGVEAREWARPGAPPAWFASLPRPRLLYVGTIDDRLDVPALVDVARRNPGGSVVLAGLVTAPGAVAPLRAVPNVRIEPPVGRDDVAAMVSAAEACLLPHRRSPLTETMSPLKVYEYLAGGGPVVATDLEPVREIDRRLVLVEPGGDFAAGVVEALGQPRLAESERLAVVDRHSWARRHDAILRLVCQPERRPDPVPDLR